MLTADSCEWWEVDKGGERRVMRFEKAHFPAVDVRHPTDSAGKLRPATQESIQRLVLQVRFRLRKK